MLSPVLIKAVPRWLKARADLGSSRISSLKSAIAPCVQTASELGAVCISAESQAVGQIWTEAFYAERQKTAKSGYIAGHKVAESA